MRGIQGILLARTAPFIMSAPGANTLTALIPDIYAALDVVSRELVGFIPSAMRSPSVERAAVGQTVKIPVGQVQQAVDIVPAMTIPEPPDNTFTTGSMAITKSRAIPFGFTGEEQLALSNGGPGYLSARGMIIAEAVRAITNEVETDLAVEAAGNASRAYGTPGTTPFATDDLSPISQSRKILNDNGAPVTGRSLVLNSTAAANLINVKNLRAVNEAGTQMTLRQGEILPIFNFSVKETGASVDFVKGTAASATTNAAGYAVGSTLITLAAAGTGTIKDNDVVQFAGDPNKYMVEVGDASTADGGTIRIASPGLRVAIPAVATAITLGNSYSAAGVGFSQNALHVAMRAPAVPEEGDAAKDRVVIVDPRSGVAFEFSIWEGYRKIRYEVALAWGVKAVKPAHIVLMLG